MRTLALSGFTLAAIIATVFPAPVRAASSVQAVWVARRVQFFYAGFATRADCRDLHAELLGMLRRLGARDVKVREPGCQTGTGRPQAFPSVRVTMRVLIPARRAPAASPRIEAHWREVTLVSQDVALNEAGKCQLIEVFRRVLLRTFVARDVAIRAPCLPRAIGFGTDLSARVLVANRPAVGAR